MPTADYRIQIEGVQYIHDVAELCLAVCESEVCIYGAGSRGRLLRKTLETQGTTICCFIDTFAHGQTVDGLPVLGPQDRGNIDCKTIIMASHYAGDIVRRLRTWQGKRIIVDLSAETSPELLQQYEAVPAKGRCVLVLAGSALVAPGAMTHLCAVLHCVRQSPQHVAAIVIVGERWGLENEVLGVPLMSLEAVSGTDVICTADALCICISDATTQQFISFRLAQSPLRLPMVPLSNRAVLHNTVLHALKQLHAQRAIAGRPLRALELGSINELCSVRSTVHLCSLIGSEGSILTVDQLSHALELSAFLCSPYGNLHTLHADILQEPERIHESVPHGVDLPLLHIGEDGQDAEYMPHAFDLHQHLLPPHGYLLYQSIDFRNGVLSQHLLSKGWHITTHPYCDGQSGMCIATRPAPPAS